MTDCEEKEKKKGEGEDDDEYEDEVIDEMDKKFTDKGFRKSYPKLKTPQTPSASSAIRKNHQPSCCSCDTPNFRANNEGKGMGEIQKQSKPHSFSRTFQS
jgi:hypothetical protein